MSDLSELTALVLGPLAGKAEASWQQAPPGKWTSAQIVEHLALALEMSAKTFASRSAKEPMSRRGTTFLEKVGKVFTFGLGRFPPGLKAPEAHDAATPGRRSHGRSALPECARGVGRGGARPPARSSQRSVRQTSAAW